MDKVAELVKLARMSKEQQNAKARQRYRLGGQQLRRRNKVTQRKKRRQGGSSLKARVKMQEERRKFRPIRIRKDPLQHRPRDMS